ncbi:alpha/beta hydrolase [Rhizobium halophytocola]|uniref:Esterase/lipase superfamily enzyme n=1 Tax=Rhizobium halophytocola TaxID=735519 RepID=A0ABS4DTR5_9HYPH|nr:esterase/lipase superfamily enzyme [Rhizobium halophytocola]
MILAGCVTRPGPDDLTPVKPVAEAKTVQVFVATTRATPPAGEKGFTSDRAEGLNFARYTVSLPPGHKSGEIEWPENGRPDPRKTFAVLARETLTPAEFYAQIRQKASHLSKDRADVGVFVHGFNTNFQEALFRVVQMSGDSSIDGVPVLFSWPSKASVAGYVADKESVTYSRDYLVDMLTKLTVKRDGRHVLLFGHSMGGWLVTESLRQLKLMGRTDVLHHLEVLLAAPDVDADVFGQQMAVIGPLSPPMVIFVSTDDRALLASSLISGDVPRIGALDVHDPIVEKVAREEKIVLVDVSSLQGTGRLNHDRYVQLAALYPKLSQQKQTINDVGGFVLEAAATTVASPFRLVKLVVDPQ